MAKNYTVYGLSDPRTPEVIRYVGATSRALKARLADHCAKAATRRSTSIQKWLGSLLESGLRPIITPLEECPESEATTTEGKWIGLFRPEKDGLRMVNGNFPGRIHDLTLAQKLKNWRGEYAQKQAAAALGVSLSTYQNWEYGDNIPSILAMRQIEKEIRQPISDWVKTIEPNHVPEPQ